jgi:hypothetical protein
VDDPNYKLYRDGKNWALGLSITRSDVHQTGWGGGINELTQFQEHFKEHRIVVFSGLNSEDVLFDEEV